MKIQWTNKYSHETGYVKCLNRREKYFENTFDIEEAQIFSVRQVERVIEVLEQYCSDNTYEAVPV